MFKTIGLYLRELEVVALVTKILGRGKTLKCTGPINYPHAYPSVVPRKNYTNIFDRESAEYSY